MKKILIIQTAFIGDVVLTTPLVSGLITQCPEAEIDILSIPAGAEVWKNNPHLSKVIIFDKNGADKKIVSLLKLIMMLRKNCYDQVISPHRSLRSGLISFFSGASLRTSFDRSVGAKIFYNDVIPYRQVHEIERNLSLINFDISSLILPTIFPSPSEKGKIDRLIKEKKLNRPFIVIAPGSIWKTKRWPEEKYADLISKLLKRGNDVCLIGGKEDLHLGRELCKESQKCFNFIGKLNIRESYQLIKMSACLISNDSAPLHLGSAAGVPSLALFGPTITEFGFSPYGNEKSVVFETRGLTCRPCGIHGGDKCPEQHFNCMKQIDVRIVLKKTEEILADDISACG